MSFDFWSVVNSAEFQNQAATENESVGGGFKRFTEDGEYTLTIKHPEVRQTKSGCQKLTLRVQADSGESGFWDLLVGHGDGKSVAAKIAQQNLALILKYSGAKATSPSDLAGLRVKVWVKMEEREGYDPSPRFRPIGPADGSAGHLPPVAKPAAVKPVQAAPAADDIGDDDIPF